MKQYKFLCLLVLFISKYSAQESTTISSINWNGDSKICIVDSSDSSTDDLPLPLFPNQAKFVIEKVKINHIPVPILPSELTVTHYLYNYDNNTLVLIKHINNTTDTEHYYYEKLKKSIYHRQNICTISDINKEIEIDSTSAIRLPNNTWHIRPLDQFLLFTSNNSYEIKIQQKFLGQSIIRGIPVDQWETCIINKTELRTYKIIWSLAQKGISMPTGIVGDIAVPIHALINTSIVNSDNTEIDKYDEIYHVHSYKSKLVNTDDYFVPPKGVFCRNNSNEYLKTLEEFGIQWSDYFSVRVETSTSRSSQWQRFHLRYNHNPQFGIRRLRYDYSPPGVEHYLSVIHDYGDNLTYVIDRYIGTCRISRGVEYPDVDPIRDPIGFFIKHENEFIFNSNEKVWDFNGNRLCRSDSIRCLSVITSLNNYPVIITPDTGTPSDETWTKTDIEYGWSVRGPNARLSPEIERYFDYPVYLFLRFYQYKDANIFTEDIEYEFYEISYERNPYDFDISLCYRSLNFDYLHLSFILKLNQENLTDNNQLDRRLLEQIIHEKLLTTMTITYKRITDIEIIHEDINSDIIIFFTLLGQTPRPEPPFGFIDTELTVNQSYTNLKKSIDDGTFQFTLTSNIQFQAISGSLKSSKQFMSTHTIGKQIINKKYSTAATISGVIGGLIVGLLIGILLVALFRIIRREPMPYLPNSFENPLPTINFYNKKSTTVASDA